MLKRLLVAAATAALLAGAASFTSAEPSQDHHGGPADNHGPGGRNWNTGGRIAKGDWARGQQVDYRAHHLRAPPHGYEWREVDGNYILAAAATGLIADVLINH